MWCTVDAIDVREGSGDLKYDPQWGWVHQAEDKLHTLSGTFLERKDDKLVPLSFSHSNLPAIIIDLRP